MLVWNKYSMSCTCWSTMACWWSLSTAGRGGGLEPVRATVSKCMTKKCTHKIANECRQSSREHPIDWCSSIYLIYVRINLNNLHSRSNLNSDVNCRMALCALTVADCRILLFYYSLFQSMTHLNDLIGEWSGLLTYKITVHIKWMCVYAGVTGMPGSCKPLPEA